MNMKMLLALVATAAVAITAPSVAGTWSMTVDGGPHGTLKMALTLKQEETKVTGTFASPHGDMAVEGTFENDALKLAAGEGSITFTAKLKEDGTLAGYLSSEMGDMKWTAERVADKDRK